MNWLPGRQGGGYLKLPLFSFKHSDGYLIRYPKGTCVTQHTDKVPGRRHYRLNILLKKPREGGELMMLGMPLLRLGRICLFRPDITSHWVTHVVKGERWVLSLGTARE